jgi:hypothetical protein
MGWELELEQLRQSDQLKTCFKKNLCLDFVVI